MTLFITPRDRSNTLIKNCYYHEGIAPLVYPPLTGAVKADVCIVGGGFSGLAAADYLQQAGLKVVLLEREHIGWGASGRNGGQVLHGFNQSLDWLMKKLGEADGVALWRDTLDTIRTIAARVHRWGIACDWQEGVIIACPNRDAVAALKQEIALWAAHLGHELKTLDRQQISDHLGSPLYQGGAYDSAGRHFHPYKYALGFAKGLTDRGVQIYQGTPALAVNKGTVTTPQGQVSAGTVIYCGNAYQGGLLPQFRERVVLMRTSMLATEPLPQEVLSTVMPSNTSVYEWCNLLNYYRLTADGRLLFGGGDSPMGRGADASEVVYAGLTRAMVRTFPQLKDVRPSHYWSGTIAITSTNMPYVTRLADGAYVTGGYSGHGVVPSHLMGRYVAEAILGNEQNMATMARLTPFKIPGSGRYDRVLSRTALTLMQWQDKFHNLKS